MNFAAAYLLLQKIQHLFVPADMVFSVSTLEELELGISVHSTFFNYVYRDHLHTFPCCLNPIQNKIFEINFSFYRNTPRSRSRPCFYGSLLRGMHLPVNAKNVVEVDLRDTSFSWIKVFAIEFIV